MSLLKILTMISNDEEISLILLSPPYYRSKFTKVLMNPFSIILFGYLGKIDEEIYRYYLKIFKKTIMEPSNDEYSLKGLPYIQVLNNGETWDIIKKDPNPLSSLLKMIEEEDSKDYNIYFFLAEFFKLNIKLYNSSEEITKPSGYFLSFYDKNSERDYYIYVHKDNNLYPILMQEIDGCVRVLSNKI